MCVWVIAVEAIIMKMQDSVEGRMMYVRCLEGEASWDEGGMGRDGMG